MDSSCRGSPAVYGGEDVTTRTTISLPKELVERLDSHCPDDMSRPEFFEEVVLPALAGDSVEITVDGALPAAIQEQLDVIEGKIDNNLELSDSDQEMARELLRERHRQAAENDDVDADQ